MHDCRVHYSPYGTWKLTVVDHASLQLDTVTDVRFEFNLQYKPSLFGGDPVFFEGDMGCMIELGVPATCNEGCAAVLLPAQAACADEAAGRSRCCTMSWKW